MNNKKVLLTGATGLIGKEAIMPLLNAGFDVFAISHAGLCQSKQKNVRWIKANLFDDDSIWKICKDIKPEYLLHFAWYTGEDYLTSEINCNLRDASLKMLEVFHENGGRRVVYAGTCFEYKFKDIPLKENDTLKPATLYAQCKNTLREQAERYAKDNDISFGWGRIFYVAGHGERENRLLPYIVDSLADNRKALVKSGPLMRDYMYTIDIAGAFVKFLNSNVTGCVNICSGKGITIHDFAVNIATILKKPDLLCFVNDIQNQPPIIIGDNTRLTDEIGYQFQYDMDVALKEIINSR
jgi:nucleoside-diphosphate-sugar epimerase